MGQVIYIGSLEGYLELDKKKTKDPDKYRKIEIVYDLNKIRKEVNKMSNDQEKDDLKRFTEEEKKVSAFLEKNPKMSYREAALTVLDRSEPETKKEFTEEEKRYIQEEKENLEKVEEYIEKCRSQGIEISYREAALKVLDSSEPEGTAEKFSEITDQEIINMHTTINDIIYSLGKAEKSAVFKTEDKSKINQALDLITEVKESLQKLIDKKGGSEPD